MKDLIKYKWMLHSIRAGGLAVGVLEISPDGDFIKLSDVEEALRSASDNTPQLAIALSLYSQYVDESGVEQDNGFIHWLAEQQQASA